jgi:hypothetical protein
MPVKKKVTSKSKSKATAKAKASSKSSVVVKIDQRKITKGRASAPAPRQTTTFIGSSASQPYYPQPQQQPSISFAPVVSQGSATQVSEKYPGLARIIGEPIPTANYMIRTPYNPTIDVNMNRAPVTETRTENSYRIFSNKPPKSQISIATPGYVTQVAQKIKTPFPTREQIQYDFSQSIDTMPSQMSGERLPSAQGSQSPAFETVSIGGPGYYGVGSILLPDTSGMIAEPLTNKSKKTVTNQPVKSKTSSEGEIPVGIEYEEDVFPPPSIQPIPDERFGLTLDEIQYYAFITNKTPREAQSILRQRIYERKGARDLEPRIQREISLAILAKAQKKYEKANPGGKSK